jgi:hypothetical protein
MEAMQRIHELTIEKIRLAYIQQIEAVVAVVQSFLMSVRFIHKSIPTTGVSQQ